jgi:hypothetical protein
MRITDAVMGVDVVAEWVGACVRPRARDQRRGVGSCVLRAYADALDGPIALHRKFEAVLLYAAVRRALTVSA